MSYQSVNNVPVTPITMLKGQPDDSEYEYVEGMPYFDEGFQVPKVYQGRRRERYTPMPPPRAADTVPQTTPQTPTSDPVSDLTCELKQIKYLLFVLVALFLLFLIFKR